MAPSTLIPLLMVGVLVVSLVCGLLGRRAGTAMLVSLALFVVSLWFPQTVAQEHRNLHWFPVSLLLLILTVVGTAATLVIGWLVRMILATVLKRDEADRVEGRARGSNARAAGVDC